MCCKTLFHRGCLVAGLLATLGLTPATSHAETVTVDASEAVGSIPAIHGVNSGPLLKDHTGDPPWNVTCGNHNTHDFTEQFAAVGIPQARSHDQGPFDLPTVWRPWPEFAGHDPTDPANYNWTISDEFAAATVAAGSQLYPMIGVSNTYCPNPGIDEATIQAIRTPPDKAVYAEIVKRVLMHYTEGWPNDTGFTYDIGQVEIWTEPNVPYFWNGTALQYHDLYVAARAAVHEHFGDAIDCVLHLGREQFSQNVVAAFDPATEPIDAVANHFYSTRPIATVLGLTTRENNTPDLLEKHGYSRDTPIYVSEWNRDNWGNAIPVASYAACSLIYFVGFHPDNVSPITGESHSVVMSHYYASEANFWDDETGEEQNLGVLWRVYGQHMVGETPGLLSTTGWRSDETKQGTDFCVLSGRSDNRQQVNVLVADYTNRPDKETPAHPGVDFSLEVVVNDLPWGTAKFSWERWRHDTESTLRLADSGSASGSTSWSFSGTGKRSTYELFKLVADEPPRNDGNTDGNTDGGADADAGKGDKVASSGCQCSVGTSGDVGGWGLTVLAALLALLWLRRRSIRRAADRTILPLALIQARAGVAGTSVKPWGNSDDPDSPRRSLLGG